MEGLVYLNVEINGSSRSILDLYLLRVTGLLFINLYGEVDFL